MIYFFTFSIFTVQSPPFGIHILTGICDRKSCSLPFVHNRQISSTIAGFLFPNPKPNHFPARIWILRVAKEATCE